MRRCSIKPYTHAKSSAAKWGGVPEDYLPIHQLMDSSKAALPDHRHRALTHNSWFVGVVLEQVFGVNLTNSEGHKVSVREIGEQHCLEDFGGIIPTAQDYLMAMDYQKWMGGKGLPPSQDRIKQTERKTVIDIRKLLTE